MDKKFKGVLLSGKDTLLKNRSLAQLRVRIVAILQMALSVFSLVNGVLLLVYSVQSVDIPYVLAGPLWSGALVVLGAIFGVLVSVTRANTLNIPGKTKALMILNLIMSILNTLLCLLSSGLGAVGIVFCFVEVPYFSERCQGNKIQRIALSGIATFIGLGLSVLSVLASCLLCFSSRALGLTRKIAGKIRSKVHPGGKVEDQQATEDAEMELENFDEAQEDGTEPADQKKPAKKAAKNKVFATPSSKQLLQTGTALAKTAGSMSGGSNDGGSFGGSSGTSGLLQTGLSVSRAASGTSGSGGSFGGSADAAGFLKTGASLGKAAGGERGSANGGIPFGGTKDNTSLMKTGTSLARAAASASGNTNSGGSFGSSNELDMMTKTLGGGGGVGGDGGILLQTKSLQGGQGGDDPIGQAMSLAGQLPLGKAKKMAQSKLKPKKGKPVPKSRDNEDNDVLLEDAEDAEESQDSLGIGRSATSALSKTSSVRANNNASTRRAASKNQRIDIGENEEEAPIPGEVAASSNGGKKTRTQKILDTSAKVLKTAGKVAAQLNDGNGSGAPF